VPVAADERQLPVVRAEALHPADQDTEGGRIDEGGRGEVHDHLLAALPDHLEQLLLELRSRVEIDLAGQGDHVRVVGDLLGLDVEVHSSPMINGGRTAARESTSRRTWWLNLSTSPSPSPLALPSAASAQP